jgi:probable addiction module antidote protein
MDLTVLERPEGTAPERALAAYLAAAFQTADPEIIAHALGVAARAKGMSHVAQHSGCAREQLYRSLSKKGNPTLKTILAILGALRTQARDQPRSADKKTNRER